MLSERFQIAVMQRGIGVFLRVDHPDHRVDQLDQPIHLEPVGGLRRVVVRQVEQDQPVQLRDRAAAESVPARDLQPLQQLLVHQLAAPDRRQRG